MIRRSDDALRVNPDFYTIALDGVYVRDERGELVFHVSHSLPAERRGRPNRGC